jgi:hypothetical protein
MIAFTCYAFASNKTFAEKRVQCVPDVKWDQCIKEGKFETTQFQFWTASHGLPWQVRHLDHATNPPCSQERFPILHTTDSRVDNWIQIILFHRPAPDEPKLTGFNISESKDNWIMVDTSQESRKIKRPFYKSDAIDHTFYDSPCWNVTEKENINWLALLFPVKINKKQIFPLSGIQWGYVFDGPTNRITPIPVTQLQPSTWDLYRLRLEKSYPQWSFVKAVK